MSSQNMTNGELFQDADRLFGGESPGESPPISREASEDRATDVALLRARLAAWSALSAEQPAGVSPASPDPLTMSPGRQRRSVSAAPQPAGQQRPLTPDSPNAHRRSSASASMLSSSSGGGLDRSLSPSGSSGLAGSGLADSMHRSASGGGVRASWTPGSPSLSTVPSGDGPLLLKPSANRLPSHRRLSNNARLFNEDIAVASAASGSAPPAQAVDPEYRPPTADSPASASVLLAPSPRVLVSQATTPPDYLRSTQTPPPAESPSSLSSSAASVGSLAVPASAASGMARTPSAQMFEEFDALSTDLQNSLIHFGSFLSAGTGAGADDGGARSPAASFVLGPAASSLLTARGLSASDPPVGVGGVGSRSTAPPRLWSSVSAVDAPTGGWSAEGATGGGADNDSLGNHNVAQSRSRSATVGSDEQSSENSASYVFELERPPRRTGYGLARSSSVESDDSFREPSYRRMAMTDTFEADSALTSSSAAPPRRPSSSSSNAMPRASPLFGIHWEDPSPPVAVRHANPLGQRVREQGGSIVIPPHLLPSAPIVDTTAVPDQRMNAAARFRWFSKRDERDAAVVERFGFDRLSSYLPPCLDQSLAFLEHTGALREEGLFRLCGSVMQMKLFKRSYDKGQHKVDLTSSDPHTVAGLVKLWFRELPQPIFCLEYYEALKWAATMPDHDTRVRCLRKVVKLLPPGNNAILKRFFGFLKTVEMHQHVNKMTARNLAIVLSPSLFRTAQQDIAMLLKDERDKQLIIATLITDYEAVFLMDRASANLDGQQKAATPPLSEDFKEVLRRGRSSLAASMQLESSESQPYVTDEAPSELAPEEEALYRSVVAPTLADAVTARFQAQPGPQRDSISIPAALLPESLPDQGGQTKRRWFQRKKDYGFDRWSAQLPPLVEQTIAFLEEHERYRIEGLFRVPGSSVQLAKLKKLFDRGSKVVDFTRQDPHTVAGLLKLWLRQLPEPIFCYEYYEALKWAVGMQEHDQRLHCLRKVFHRLPPGNRAILTHLFGLLRLVEQSKSTSKMTASNLATMMSPCLFRAPAGDDSPLSLLQVGQDTQLVVTTMIEHYDEVCLQQKAPGWKMTGQQEFKVRLSRGITTMLEKALNTEIIGGGTGNGGGQEAVDSPLLDGGAGPAEERRRDSAGGGGGGELLSADNSMLGSFAEEFALEYADNPSLDAALNGWVNVNPTVLVVSESRTEEAPAPTTDVVPESPIISSPRLALSAPHRRPSSEPPLSAGRSPTLSPNRSLQIGSARGSHP